MFVVSVRQELLEVADHALQRFLGCEVAQAGLLAQQLLGGGQQRPSPAVLFAVFVAGIDEVLGDNAASHLQTGDIAVKLTAHLRSRKPAGCT